MIEKREVTGYQVGVTVDYFFKDDWIIGIGEFNREYTKGGVY